MATKAEKEDGEDMRLDRKTAVYPKEKGEESRLVMHIYA